MIDKYFVCVRLYVTSFHI